MSMSYDYALLSAEYENLLMTAYPNANLDDLYSALNYQDSHSIDEAIQRCFNNKKEPSKKEKAGEKRKR